jgi:tetratricopeptide (TPR) repeat protein
MEDPASIPVERTWPSRRVQIFLIVILASAALIRVFLPPFSVEDRAERLHLRAWGEHSVPDSNSEKRADAVNKLEAALKLSPGNDLYEQALVWHYDRAQLETLVKDRQLGANAMALAAGLMAEEAHMQWRVTLPVDSPDTEVDSEEQQLAILEALQAADPQNSLVRYRKAFLLEKLQRTEEAIAQVRAGNTAGGIRLYVPDVSSRLMGTSLYHQVKDMRIQHQQQRRIAGTLLGRANDLLRVGETDTACAILEDCCLMGVRVAATEPHEVIEILVGSAIFSIGAAELDPLYADLGMQDHLLALRQTEQALDRAVESLSFELQAGSYDSDIVRVTAPLVLWSIGGSAAVCILLTAAILLVPVTAIRKRKRQDVLSLRPWGEGWLARVLLAAYLPLFALLVLLLAVSSSLLPFYDGGYTWMSSLVGACIAIGLLQIGILAVTLRKLHYVYDQGTGEPTRMLHFLLKAPAAAKAWTRKYVAVLMGAQMLFLGCVMAYLILVYEPWAGGHPWEPDKFILAGSSNDRVIAENLAGEIAASWTLPDGATQNTDAGWPDAHNPSD